MRDCCSCTHFAWLFKLLQSSGSYACMVACPHRRLGKSRQLSACGRPHHGQPGLQGAKERHLNVMWPSHCSSATQVASLPSRSGSRCQMSAPPLHTIQSSSWTGTSASCAQNTQEPAMPGRMLQVWCGLVCIPSPLQNSLTSSDKTYMYDAPASTSCLRKLCMTTFSCSWLAVHSPPGGP